MLQRHTLSWMLALSLILGSCTDTQFATTKRTYKDGHYVYVKHNEKKIAGLKSANRIKSNSKTDPTLKACNPQTNEVTVMPVENLNQLAGVKIPPELFARLLADNLKSSGMVGMDKSIQTTKPNPLSFSTKKAKKRSGSSIIEYSLPLETKQTGIRDHRNPDTIYVKTDQPSKFIKKRNVSVGSMVVGIIGLFIAGIILGTIAIVTGIFGLRKRKRYPEQYKGRGFAIAGIILGVADIIGIFIALAIILNNR